jgi:hypothetical protein
MRVKSAPDRAIAQLFGRQGGFVSHDQLTALGLSRQAIERRIATGSLHARHRGVYAVGHRVAGAEGRRWAAVLALGDDAFLSHDSAADAFGIRRSSSGLVHVTVRGRGGRRRQRGIRVHRPHVLAGDEVTKLRGLPITTPARTILDLAAAGLHGRPLEDAHDQAELESVLDFGELHRLLARYRSELERLAYELCDDRGLPRPLVNTVIEGRVRDFFWPHRGLVVERTRIGFIARHRR